MDPNDSVIERHYCNLYLFSVLYFHDYAFQEYITDLLGAMNHGSHKIFFIFRCHFCSIKSCYSFYLMLSNDSVIERHYCNLDLFSVLYIHDYAFQEYKTDLLGAMNHGSHKICFISHYHFISIKSCYPFMDPNDSVIERHYCNLDLFSVHLDTRL